jgi:hypothetical protein
MLRAFSALLDFYSQQNVCNKVKQRMLHHKA